MLDYQDHFAVFCNKWVIGPYIITSFLPPVKSLTSSLSTPSGLRTSSAFLWPRAAPIHLETRKKYWSVRPLISSSLWCVCTITKVSINTSSSIVCFLPFLLSFSEPLIVVRISCTSLAESWGITSLYSSKIFITASSWFWVKSKRSPQSRAQTFSSIHPKKKLYIFLIMLFMRR